MGDIGRLMCRREQSTERRVWRMKKVYSIRVDIGFGFVRVRYNDTLPYICRHSWETLGWIGVCDVAGLGFDRLRLFSLLAWASAEHELNRCTPPQKKKIKIRSCLSVCLAGWLLPL